MPAAGPRDSQQRQIVDQFGGCSVCDLRATGVHYGATTCNACKTFFKRTVHSCLTYQCARHNAGDDLCPVREPNRKQCPACRWRRCLRANMQPGMLRSVEAGTETERYPRLKRQRHEETPPTPPTPPPLTPPSQPTLPPPLPPLDLHSQLIAIDSPPITLDGVPDPEITTAAQLAYRLTVCTEQLITNLVKFAKAVPGFELLPMPDKVLLIQLHCLDLCALEVAINSVPYNGNIVFCTNLALNESYGDRFRSFFSPKSGMQLRCFIRWLTMWQVTRPEFLLLKAIFLLETPAGHAWQDQGQIELAQTSYLRELRRVCPDSLRRGSLLMLLNNLVALKIASVGFWSTVLQSNAFLPPQLVSEMLEFSLNGIPHAVSARRI